LRNQPQLTIGHSSPLRARTATCTAPIDPILFLSVDFTKYTCQRELLRQIVRLCPRIREHAIEGRKRGRAIALENDSYSSLLIAACFGDTLHIDLIDRLATPLPEHAVALATQE
jgi:hypothetical protein